MQHLCNRVSASNEELKKNLQRKESEMKILHGEICVKRVVYSNNSSNDTVDNNNDDDDDN